jgi:hypothetical protein
VHPEEGRDERRRRQRQQEQLQHEANQNRLGKLIIVRTPVLWKVNCQSLLVGSDKQLHLQDGSIEPIRKANQSENTCSLDGKLSIFSSRE